MDSKLTSHDPWDCWVFFACYVLPGMRYVLRVMCCVVRGGPFSCASSPAELWPLSNLPGRGFDGVHNIHST